jgi:hypothetical protein
MKDRRIIDITSTYCYCSGYDGSLTFTDEIGNEVNVKLSDDLLTKLSAELRDKAIEIRTKRMEAAKEALENDEGSTNADL